MPGTAFILVTHGSKSQKWSTPFKRITYKLKQKNKSKVIYITYLEFNKPLLKDLLPKIAAKNFSHIKVVPFFLSCGRHMTLDITDTIKKTRNKFPSLKINLLPPIGNHPKVISAITEAVGSHIK